MSRRLSSKRIKDKKSLTKNLKAWLEIILLLISIILVVIVFITKGPIPALKLINSGPINIGALLEGDAKTDIDSIHLKFELNNIESVVVIEDGIGKTTDTRGQNTYEYDWQLKLGENNITVVGYKNEHAVFSNVLSNKTQKILSVTRVNPDAPKPNPEAPNSKPQKPVEDIQNIVTEPISASPASKSSDKPIVQTTKEENKNNSNGSSSQASVNETKTPTSEVTIPDTTKAPVASTPASTSVPNPEGSSTVDRTTPASEQNIETPNTIEELIPASKQDTEEGKVIDTETDINQQENW